MEQNYLELVSDLKHSLDHDIDILYCERIRILTMDIPMPREEDYGFSDVLKQCLISEAKRPRGTTEGRCNLQMYLLVVSRFQYPTSSTPIFQMKLKIVRPLYACLKKHNVSGGIATLQGVACQYKIMKKLANRNFCKNLMQNCALMDETEPVRFYLNILESLPKRRFVTNPAVVFDVRNAASPLPRIRRGIGSPRFRGQKSLFSDWREDVQKRYSELTHGDSRLDLEAIAEMVKPTNFCGARVPMTAALSLKVIRYLHRNMDKDKEAMKVFLDCFATITYKNGHFYSCDGDRFVRFIFLIKHAVETNLRVLFRKDGENYQCVELRRFWEESVFYLYLLHRLHDFNENWFECVDLPNAPLLVEKDSFQIRTSDFFRDEGVTRWSYALYCVCPLAFSEESVKRMDKVWEILKQRTFY